MWWICGNWKGHRRSFVLLWILNVVAGQVAWIGPAACQESPKMARELAERMQAERAGASYDVWVLFADKGVRAPAAYEDALRSMRTRMDARALRRRRKVGAELARADLPVCPEYMDQVRECGVGIRATSRWLNGVSVQATRRQVERLAELPFVRSIEPVRKYRRARSTPSQETRPKRMVLPTVDYGASYDQLAQIRVPELHDLGYTGEGVRICMLDSGFNYRRSVAFSRTKVVGERDFVHGDSYVSDEPGQDDGDTGALLPGEHGAWTLSVVGGYREGELIGVAYDAEFLLAKTEDIARERPIEEDYWIAGLEWADSLGADVVNSSVGYTEWDDGTGYTYEDLNGDVARTTIAADMAASRGIVIVVSAGNEGSNSWKYLNVPADGDSVLAIGAVNEAGALASFSSIGPTSDGRIKPDLVAMGMRVHCVDSEESDGYQFRNGTSFSSPLVAGVCALLLEIHPEWGPAEVAEALRRTARDLGPAGPDTLYGWGLVDAFAASGLDEEEPVEGSEIVLYEPFPNPSTGTIYFPAQLPDGGTVYLEVFTVLGERVFRREQVFYPGGPDRAMVWNGLDHSGHDLGSGIYFCRLRSGAVERRSTVAIVR